MPKVPVNINGTLSAEFNLGIREGYTGLGVTNINNWTSGVNAQTWKDGDKAGIQSPNNYGKLKVDTENLYVEGTSEDLQGAGEWNILDMVTPAGLLNYYMANARIKPR